MLTTPQVTTTATASTATLWRCGGRTCPPGSCDHDDEVHRHAADGAGPTTAPAIVHEALRSPSSALPSSIRQDAEARLGHDLSHVRVHTDAPAAASAQAVHAQAYTVGSHLVFGDGKFSASTPTGRRLLMHELVHTVQQTRPSQSPARSSLHVSDPLDPAEQEAERIAATTVPVACGRGEADRPTQPVPVVTPSVGVVQRQPDSMQQVDDMDMEMERKYANSGAPKAQSCGRPSWCPGGFCSPYNSEKLAEYYRSKQAWWLLGGISAFVDSRVVPFWKDHLWGGSPPKNITTDFGKDFTNSPTTKKTTTFLSVELKKTLAAKPPAVATTSSLDITKLIPTAIAALGDPTSANCMNFSAPRDIPGNLAGGVGTNQTTCPAGAQPSPFDDERHASGTVELTRTSASEVQATPAITYLVKDTVDLCPGDCGAPAEQIATVPLSQFEATGISGDVPFTVEFPAPSVGTFTVAAPAPKAAAATPTPTPTPSAKPAKSTPTK